MALPTLFANATLATGAQLDANFQAVGIMGLFPCTCAGTNALVLTPQGGTPSLAAYSNYLAFTFIAPNTNSAAVTAQVGSLPVLSVYKNSVNGPVVLNPGDITANNAYQIIYDSALNSGAGGFHTNSPSSGVTTSIGLVATGTTTSLALVLQADYNVIATVASGTGVQIQPVLNKPIKVNNQGSNSLLVYPPIGAKFGTGSTNAPLTLTTLTVTEVFGVSATQYYKDF